MIESVWDPRLDAAIRAARDAHLAGEHRHVRVGDEVVTIPRPFPSPPDWRPHWIYFLLLDRFNNPDRPPRLAWDAETFTAQGGTIAGVRERLGYLCDLGAGALWLSPFLRERQFCYGYGAQDFLSVDPRYGTEDDLAELVDAAHARGMLVIADAVVHHAGDLFAYLRDGDWSPWAAWSDDPYPIAWRDEWGDPRWEDAPAACPRDAGIWPRELRNTRYFRRQGGLHPDDPTRGDLFSLKEFDPWHVEHADARRRTAWSALDILRRIYQYWVARLDLDGLRLDSLRHLELDAARDFCTGIREFARELGKTNFLLLGEVRSGITDIAAYIGKDPADTDALEAADSCILFPFAQALGQVVKQSRPCGALRDAHREWTEGLARPCRGTGDPVTYMVTAIDDHDTPSRFFEGPGSENDLLMALTWLFASPGVPCLYYGTEQGLHGRASDEAIQEGWLLEGVREALWGKPQAFDRGHPFFQVVRTLSDLRRLHPALTFGRTYWRAQSRDGQPFAPSGGDPALLAFSRINGTEEILVAANWSGEAWSGRLIVDLKSNPPGTPWSPIFRSRAGSAGMPPGRPDAAVERIQQARLRDRDLAGERITAVHALPVTVGPREIVILGRR